MGRAVVRLPRGFARPFLEDPEMVRMGGHLVKNLETQHAGFPAAGFVKRVVIDTLS